MREEEPTRRIGRRLTAAGLALASLVCALGALAPSATYAQGSLPASTGQRVNLTTAPLSGTETSCGTITMIEGHPASANATSATNCFYAAYQSCSTPARLVFQLLSASGSGWQEVLTLAHPGSSGACAVRDEPVSAALPGSAGPPRSPDLCASLQLNVTMMHLESCDRGGQAAPSIAFALA